MTLNLKKYQRDLTSTWQSFLKESQVGKWVCYGYEGKTLDLMHVGSGEGGFEEFVEELSDGRMMYGGVCVEDPNSGLLKIVFILWQGLGVPEQVRGKVAVASEEIKKFFNGFHIAVIARSEDELEQETIEKKVGAASGSNYSAHKEVKKEEEKPTHPVGVYKKIDPKAEITAASQKGYWNKEKMEAKEENKEPSMSAKRVAEASQLKAMSQAKAKPPVGHRQTSQAEEIKLARQKEMQEALEKSRVTRQTHDQEEDIAQSTSYKKINPGSEIESLRKNAPSTKSDEGKTTSASQPTRLPVGKLSHPAFLAAKTDSEPIQSTVKEPKITTSKVKELQAKVQSAHVDQSASLSTEKTKEPIYKKVQRIETPSPAQETKQVITEEVKEQPVITAKEQPTGIKAIALYDYDAQEELEISFIEGEIITDIVTESDDGWWIGTNSEGLRGSLPSNYVEIQEEPSQTPEQSLEETKNVEICQSIPSEEVKTSYAKVIYDFDATEDDELTVQEEEVVTILETRDDGWWMAQKADGSTGLVPSNYVEMI